VFRECAPRAGTPDAAARSHTPDGVGETDKPVLQHPPRAAEVQSDEAVSARAERVPLVEDKSRL